METSDRAAYKKWHAKRLREAIGGDPERRRLVSTATGKTYRAVGYWISETSPTMPSDKDRAAIREVLGHYDHDGDLVERTIFASELTDDRAYDVVGYYKKRLREQRESSPGREEVS